MSTGLVATIGIRGADGALEGSVGAGALVGPFPGPGIVVGTVVAVPVVVVVVVVVGPVVAGAVLVLVPVTTGPLCDGPAGDTTTGGFHGAGVFTTGPLDPPTSAPGCGIIANSLLTGAFPGDKPIRESLDPLGAVKPLSDCKSLQPRASKFW
ncbi:MAG TPA: hypothetical protein PK803_02805 [Alphaproteobacteria bacterium]|nr:hypothetical protein [Alphaproteobacteria bacterium]